MSRPFRPLSPTRRILRARVRWSIVTACCCATIGPTTAAAVAQPLPTRVDALLAIEPRRLSALVEQERPAPLSAAARGAALRMLPGDGEITDLDERAQAKLASLGKVLGAAEREGVYTVTIIDLPQAAVANYFRAGLLVSKPALDLLEPAELQALAAHEVAHEYVWAEYEAARASGDDRWLRELELVCDAIATVMLRSQGVEPAALPRAIERITRYNAIRFGKAADESRYPTVDERRQLSRRLARTAQFLRVDGKGGARRSASTRNAGPPPR